MRWAIRLWWMRNRGWGISVEVLFLMVVVCQFTLQWMKVWRIRYSLPLLPVNRDMWWAGVERRWYAALGLAVNLRNVGSGRVIVISLQIWDWFGTILFASALLAHGTIPNAVELFHSLLDYLRIIGKNASLEVSCVFWFHSYPCTSEVSTADVNFLAVEDYHLKVYTRAENSFKSVEENRVLVEVLSESRTWFFGMDETHVNTFAD